MQCSLDTNCPHVKCAARRCAPMASSPRINTQLGARQTLELRRKARLPVHRPSACSGDLIAGDGTKNGLSRSEQKTLSTTQNNRLTGEAPYKSTAEPFLLGFSTASSEAAYPVTMAQLEKLPVSKKIISFVLPMGYSFNLDGSMMYCTFAVIFISQAYNIPLSVP